jgi:hypothetical protein
MMPTWAVFASILDWKAASISLVATIPLFESMVSSACILSDDRSGTLIAEFADKILPLCGNNVNLNVNRQ